jgi:hypothetical protein
MGLVQIVTTDPAPSNNVGLGGAGDVIGSGQEHLCVASPLGFTAGNYLLAIGCISNFADILRVVVKFSDPLNGDWPPLDQLNCRSAPNGVIDGLNVLLSLAPITQTIAPGFVGLVSASAAGSATCTKFDGTSPGWTTGQWNAAVCQEYASGSGGTISATTGGNTIAFSGGQTPGVGSPIVVGGFVKMIVEANDDYTAATVTEWSGISGLIGHCCRSNTYAAAANLSTGAIPPWVGSATAISFGIDDNDDSAGPYNPLAVGPNTGGPNTDDGVLWKWNISTAIMRMQHAVVNSPADWFSMNFAVQGPADHHMAFLVVLRNAASAPAPTPSGIIIPRRRPGGLSMGLNIKEWW